MTSGLNWARVSWNTNRATRVPVSSSVRMKRASNMITKWYQYDMSTSHAREAGKDLGHADRQRDCAARAPGQFFARAAF